MKHTSHSRAIRILSGQLYFFSIFVFINAFNFQHNPPGAWRQQHVLPIGSRGISDITFVDSLTGFAVTPYVANDTAFIVKTTDGGETWFESLKGPTNTIGGFSRIMFLDINTGYACHNFLWKTTNSGQTWFNVNTSGIFPENMFVLNEDTIWLTHTNSLTGGVFRTINGGTSWVRQLSLGSFNPDRIYMIDGRNGFISQVKDGPMYVRKTSNAGLNWFIVDSNQSSWDMVFSDSLHGWSAGGFVIMKTTTNGGLSWHPQSMPSGGLITSSSCYKMSLSGLDSLWGVGGYIRFGPLNSRGILYFTSNAGANWYYQLPDTTIRISEYRLVDFKGKSNGWAYSNFRPTGIHTTTGGDTTSTSVRPISDILPGEFILHQNYPNPFNGSTKIRFELNKGGTVTIEVFDITGRKLVELVNKQFASGEYEVDYTTNENSSGVYFYSLSVDGTILDTKKMIVLK